MLPSIEVVLETLLKSSSSHFTDLSYKRHRPKTPQTCLTNATDQKRHRLVLQTPQTKNATDLSYKRHRPKTPQTQNATDLSLQACYNLSTNLSVSSSCKNYSEIRLVVTFPFVDVL